MAFWPTPAVVNFGASVFLVPVTGFEFVRTGRAGLRSLFETCVTCDGPPSLPIVCFPLAGLAGPLCGDDLGVLPSRLLLSESVPTFLVLPSLELAVELANVVHGESTAGLITPFSCFRSCGVVSSFLDLVPPVLPGPEGLVP